MKFTLQLNLSPSIVALLMAYQKKWDNRHSLEYIAEECILTGVVAKDRSKQYSEETYNSKQFTAAIAADPSIVADPVRMAALAKKYKVGASKGGQALATVARGIIAEAGSPAELDEAALEAATKPEAVA